MSTSSDSEEELLSDSDPEPDFAQSQHALLGLVRWRSTALAGKEPAAWRKGPRRSRKAHRQRQALLQVYEAYRTGDTAHDRNVEATPALLAATRELVLLARKEEFVGALNGILRTCFVISLIASNLLQTS